MTISYPKKTANARDLAVKTQIASKVDKTGGKLAQVQTSIEGKKL